MPQVLRRTPWLAWAYSDALSAVNATPVVAGTTPAGQQGGVCRAWHPYSRSGPHVGTVDGQLYDLSAAPANATLCAPASATSTPSGTPSASPAPGNATASPTGSPRNATEATFILPTGGGLRRCGQVCVFTTPTGTTFAAPEFQLLAKLPDTMPALVAAAWGADAAAALPVPTASPSPSMSPTPSPSMAPPVPGVVQWLRVSSLSGFPNALVAGTESGAPVTDSTPIEDRIFVCR